jgi:hypothetical protein
MRRRLLMQSIDAARLSPVCLREDAAMFRLRRVLSLFLLIVLAGCTNAAVTAIPGPIPPPAPGAAQIILYRDIGYYEPADVLRVALNQQPAGVLPRGDVLYRNVAPGSYTISFSPTRPDPYQFKTVTLGPGDVPMSSSPRCP